MQETKSNRSKKAVDPRGMAMLDENGHEVVSNVPEAPPLGWRKQPTMIDHIRNMIRSEKLREEAAAAGNESFEDADDFDVGDDLDPTSPYEAEFEPVKAVKARKEVADAEERVVKAGAEAAKAAEATTATAAEAQEPEKPKPA